MEIITCPVYGGRSLLIFRFYLFMEKLSLSWSLCNSGILASETNEEYFMKFVASKKGDHDIIPVSINDAVLVHSEKQPRGFWKLAMV